MRRFLFGLALGAALGWGEPVLAASDPLLMSPDFSGPTYPLSHYTWDPDGFWDRFNPIYVVANLLMLLNAFLTRLGIWILDLGYAPSGWLAPFGAIADAIQKSHFLDHIWPFFALVAAAVLLKDFAQHNLQRVMQRGMMFAVALGALLLFQALGTVHYIKMVTDAIDALSYGTSGWILTFDQPVGDPSKTRTQQAITNVNKEIWQQLIVTPWELGEVGTPGATLGEDAEEVRSITEKNVSASTPWRDVLLSYPVGDKKRNELAGILNSDDRPTSKQAFSASGRLVLAGVTLIAVLCAVLYMLAVGILLNLAYLLYLAAMISGVVILPLSLIPWEYGHSMLRWWVKALAGSVLIRIGLSAYVGITFLVQRIVATGMSSVSGGIGRMLLYPVVFVLALLILSRIWKTMQPVRRVTGNVFAVLQKTEGDGGGYGTPEGGRHMSSRRRLDPDGVDAQSEAGALQEAAPEMNRRGSIDRVLRRAGRELLGGDAAGAAYTLASGTAREAALATGSRVKEAAREAGSRMRERVSQLLGRFTAADAGDGDERNGGRLPSGEARSDDRRGHRPADSRRVDPDRLGWQGEIRDEAYWDSLFRHAPGQARQEPREARAEEGEQARVHPGPDAQPEDRAPLKSGVRAVDPDTGLEALQRPDDAGMPAPSDADEVSGLTRADAEPEANREAGAQPEERSDPAVPRANTREPVLESAARAVDPDEGAPQPVEAAPVQEVGRETEQPASDWQRWAVEPVQTEEPDGAQESGRATEASAFQRPGKGAEPVEVNVQRTNPDEVANVEATVGEMRESRAETKAEGPAGAPQAEAKAGPFRASGAEPAPALNTGRQHAVAESAGEPEPAASRPEAGERTDRAPETRQAEQAEEARRPIRENARKPPPMLRTRRQGKGDMLEPEENRPWDPDTPFFGADS